MDKRPRRLIFTDLDGTLLGADKRVSIPNQDLIVELKKKNIWVLPATGRSYEVSRHVLQDMEFDYYICFNGCLIADKKGNILYEDALEESLVWEIISFCNKHDIGITSYQGGHIYYNLPKPHILAYLERTGLKDIRSVEHPSYQAKKCYKMFIAEPEERMDWIKKQIEIYWKTKSFNLSSSGGGNLEIYAHSSNKGHAARWLCDHLNMDIQHTIAIGDADNDVELFKACGHAIAMGNASVKAKQFSDEQADINANNGWYKKISHYLID